MLLTEFSALLKLVDQEGLTTAVCKKLESAGAVDTTGAPISSKTQSFNLIGYTCYQQDGEWKIRNS